MKMSKMFCSVAAVAMMGSAMVVARTIEVAVTGGQADSGHGYYVEYTVNGTKYRSNEMGPAFNTSVWNHMSDADRKKTIKEYMGYYADRKEQFGEATAMAMGNWYNRDWIAAADILKERLISAKFPKYQDIFTNNTYFAENLSPTCCSSYEIDSYVELRKRFAASQEFFNWAFIAYRAMQTAEWKRYQLSVRTAAGDLISLICDKALVPSITPSGALSGAEAIGQSIFSEVLEYVDKSSGFGDEIVAKMVGRRATGELAKEVMTALGNIVDCQAHIISSCLDACRTMKSEIEQLYPQLKAEEEAYNQRRTAAWIQARDEYEALPWQESPDSGIVAKLDSLQQTIAEKEELYAAAADRHNNAKAAYDTMLYGTGYSNEEIRRAMYAYLQAKAAQDAAGTALSAARTARNDYHQSVYGELKARAESFIAQYETKMTEFLEAQPTPEAYNAYYYLSNSDRYPALCRYSRSYQKMQLTADEVAPLESELGNWGSRRLAYADAMDAWHAQGRELATTAKLECCEILSDVQALDEGSRTSFGDLWDCADRVFVASGFSPPGWEREAEARKVEDERAELDYFLSMWTAYNQVTKVELDKRLEDMEMAKWLQYLNITREYGEAFDELDASLDNLPDYVKSQTLCLAGPVVTANSELAQRFVADGASGTVGDALNVRAELTAAADAYHAARERVNAVEREIEGFEAWHGSIDEVKTPTTSSMVMAPASEGRRTLKASISAGFVRRTVSDGRLQCRLALLALQRDFDNFTPAHCRMIEQLDDLVSNRELYSTNVLEDAVDPYVRLAYAARCQSATPKSWNYTTSMSLVMPGYYYGWGYSAYEIALMEAEDRNRGTCSYSYFIPGYAKTVGNIVSDPYDDYIKPLLDEIDAAREAASEQKILPDGPEPVDPEPAATPEAMLFDALETGELNPKGATYNGFLGEDALGGSFTLVVKKPKKDQTAAKATLTRIDPATGKKAKTNGMVDVATGLGSDGLEGLELNAKGVGGSFGGFKAQGAVDAGKAKDKDTLALMNGFNKLSYGLVFADAAGETAYLTVTFAAKGKAKVAGTFRGAKVSGSAQMSVGDRCAVPFVWNKKGVGVTFVLWFDKRAKALLAVSGLGEGATLVDAGSAGAPAAGTFGVVLDEVSVRASVPNAIDGTFQPISLAWNGKKFDAGKAAKVAYKNGALTVDTAKGPNVTGLKLAYSKGAIKGSFTVYAVVNGKLAKNKFTVAGVMVDGVGYAVATNRKLRSIPVVIAR